MRILSGIQPSILHIGNYCGAIKQWVKLQEEHECFFCIVDLHAMTANYSESIQSMSLHTAALYMACGLDPQQSPIFIQSHVPQHANLFWVLATQTPTGWLGRMTQFKSNKAKIASLGLYTYPVLMAADILLYDATHVPVGDDQKQHLEFARDLAIRINQLLGQELLTLPEPMIAKTGARIMSLKDGTAKMSKSDPTEASRISLTDSDDAIQKKIQRAKTDSLPIPKSLENLAERPEMHNLYHLLAHTINTPLATLFDTIHSCKQLKDFLTDAIITLVAPIRMRHKDFMEDKAQLLSILAHGKNQAEAVAEKKFHAILDAFLNK